MKGSMEEFDCLDCGIGTHTIKEYYMVQDDVWKSTNITEGMLCIGCLEIRLGRRLTKDDFIDCGLNRGIFGLSDRLVDRLTTG